MAIRKTPGRLHIQYIKDVGIHVVQRLGTRLRMMFVHSHPLERQEASPLAREPILETNPNTFTLHPFLEYQWCQFLPKMVLDVLDISSAFFELLQNLSRRKRPPMLPERSTMNTISGIGPSGILNFGMNVTRSAFEFGMVGCVSSNARG
jgi:hypothetical protein